MSILLNHSYNRLLELVLSKPIKDFKLIEKNTFNLDLVVNKSNNFFFVPYNFSNNDILLYKLYQTITHLNYFETLTLKNHTLKNYCKNNPYKVWLYSLSSQSFNLLVTNTFLGKEIKYYKFNFLQLNAQKLLYINLKNSDLNRYNLFFNQYQLLEPLKQQRWFIKNNIISEDFLLKSSIVTASKNLIDITFTNNNNHLNNI